MLELRPKYPFKMLLEEAQMSRGSYLYQLRKAPSKCLDAVYIEQIATIRKIHSDSKERYGYRRVMYALHNQGMHLNHKTVHKLMHHLQLQGAHPRAYKKYNSYKGTVGKIAPNILNREFNPAKPMTSFAMILLNLLLQKESYICLQSLICVQMRLLPMMLTDTHPLTRLTVC